MRRPHPWRKRAAAAVFTVAVAACVVLFLPANLGGATTYMTTHGTSMEPKFHTGDLAIVKPVSTYRVGDIAVYRSKTLHTLVMHRIIKQQGGHYFFKGDHNTWVDKDHPTRADLVGKLWLHVPHGGTVLDQLHRYWMFLLPAALLLFFGTSGLAVRRGRRRRRANAAAKSAPTTTTTRRRRRRAKPATRRTTPRAEQTKSRRGRHRGRPRAAPPSASPRSKRAKSGSRHAAARRSVGSTRAARRGSKRMRQLGAVQAIAGGALACFLALGGFAWMQAPTGVTSTTTPYKNQGAFTYSAAVPDGPVYGTRGVQTGDPVYLHVVNQLDVGFAYHFLATAAHSASGTVALDVKVSDTTGWHETVPFVAPTKFLNGVAEVNATLDLTHVQALLAAESTATGVRVSTGTVNVVASVRVAGKLAGHAFTSTFSPALAFQLDPLMLRPTSLVSGAATAAAGTTALRPSKREAVTSTRRAAATVGAFGVGLDVMLARWIGLGGAVVAAVLLLASSLLLRPLRRNEVALIDARAGHMIVPVAASTPGTQRVATIDVTTMADLVRLAERYDRLILHQSRDGAHVYLFEADGIAYRYSIRDLLPAISDVGEPTPVG